MAKKIIWTIVIIALWVLVFTVDKIRVEKNEKPWFCFPIGIEENGSGYYYGLGYKAYVVTKQNQKGQYKVKSAILGHWFEDLK